MIGINKRIVSKASKNKIIDEIESWLLDSSFIPLPSRESSCAAPSLQKLPERVRSSPISSSSSPCSSAGTRKKNLHRGGEDDEKNKKRMTQGPQYLSADSIRSQSTTCSAEGPELDNSNNSNFPCVDTTTNEDMTKMLSLLLSRADSSSQSRRDSMIVPCRDTSSTGLGRSYAQPPMDPEGGPEENSQSLLSAAELLMRSRLLTMEDQRERSQQLIDTRGSQYHQSLLIPKLTKKSQDPQNKNVCKAYCAPTRKATFKQRNFLPPSKPLSLDSSNVLLANKGQLEDDENQVPDCNIERFDVNPEKCASIDRTISEMVLKGLGKDEDGDWASILLEPEDFLTTPSRQSSSMGNKQCTTRQEATVLTKKRSFSTAESGVGNETTPFPRTNISSSFTVKRFKTFHEDKWANHFKNLQRYKAMHGDCLVPHTYPADAHLARWVKRQRRQYKLYLENDPSSTMTPERIDQLKAEGFVWDSHEATWMAKYNMLVQFQNDNGHCCVPSSSKNAPYSQLATWVKCQRRLFRIKSGGKKSPMTDKRVDLLNQINFAWEVR